MLAFAAGIGFARPALGVDTLVTPDPGSCPDGAAHTFTVPPGNLLRVAWAIETVEGLNQAGNCITLVTVDFFDDSDPCGGTIPRLLDRPETLDGDPTTAVGGYDECGFDGHFIGWQSGTPTPEVDTALRSTAINNASQYASAEFDAAADDWARTFEVAARLDKAEDLQWFIHEEEPTLVLMALNDLFLWSHELSGFDVVGTLARADRLRVTDEPGAPVHFLMPFEVFGPLHPWYVGSLNTAQVLGAVHSGLGRRRPYPEQHTLEPDLASWSVDGTTATFTLNPCRRFHDGTRVTAEDVAASLTHAPDNLPFNVGSYVRDVSVLDESTVVVELAPDFRALTFVATTAILPAHLARRRDPSVFEPAPWGVAPAVGAGPYRIAETELVFEPNQVGDILASIGGLDEYATLYPTAGRDFSVGHSWPVYAGATLERFPAYDACMGDATGAPATIRVEVEPDRDVALARLASPEPVILSQQYNLWDVRDEVDAASGVAPAALLQALDLNTRLPAFDSPEERRALSCVIDRDALVAHFLPEPERATPGITAWMPSHEGFVPDIEPYGPSNPACQD